ncbi:TnsA-like heteromeric transposase endonuclease subunit [Nocardia tengchongensis]|uniref:TnsA-like heteromeric transposase endonuclease subunit n=1 Tax=Nocardia tengchongensis TaxID=2055889 RepID=A0ABX8CYZ8_9NOCA|nr:TnsA-like heteromeric transposase endonuclease subunit [Nocardia tengchongensis]
MEGVQPWRTFVWRYGQKNYSGSYWSATMSDHVIYESRLELANLLLADFDASVKCIAAQPFLITAVIEGRVRKHIPDFAMLNESGPMIVDVKPARKLAIPQIAFTLEWSRVLVEELGWQYVIASEPDPVVGENVRFLAGYRRAWLFPADLIEELKSGAVDGRTFVEACRAFPATPVRVVKATLLHLLWAGWFGVDLGAPLQSSMVLTRGQS